MGAMKLIEIDAAVAALMSADDPGATPGAEVGAAFVQLRNTESGWYAVSELVEKLRKVPPVNLPSLIARLRGLPPYSLSLVYGEPRGIIVGDLIDALVNAVKELSDRDSGIGKAVRCFVKPASG
jgi:hypothetical protein